MCCTQSLSIDARNSCVACSRATLVEVQKKFSVPAAYKRVSNRGYSNRSVFFDSKRRYGDTREFICRTRLQRCDCGAGKWQQSGAALGPSV